MFKIEPLPVSRQGNQQTSVTEFRPFYLLPGVWKVTTVTQSPESPVSPALVQTFLAAGNSSHHSATESQSPAVLSATVYRDTQVCVCVCACDFFCFKVSLLCLLFCPGSP